MWTGRKDHGKSLLGAGSSALRFAEACHAGLHRGVSIPGPLAACWFGLSLLLTPHCIAVARLASVRGRQWEVSRGLVGHLAHIGGGPDCGRLSSEARTKIIVGFGRFTALSDITSACTPNLTWPPHFCDIRGTDGTRVNLRLRLDGENNGEQVQKERGKANLLKSPDNTHEILIAKGRMNSTLHSTASTARYFSGTCPEMRGWSDTGHNCLASQSDRENNHMEVAAGTPGTPGTRSTPMQKSGVESGNCFNLDRRDQFWGEDSATVKVGQHRHRYMGSTLTLAEHAEPINRGPGLCIAHPEGKMVHLWVKSAVGAAPRKGSPFNCPLPDAGAGRPNYQFDQILNQKQDANREFLASHKQRKRAHFPEGWRYQAVHNIPGGLTEQHLKRTGRWGYGLREAVKGIR
ncbi:hypothetical protein HOY80DRAFT_1102917 [Tuber brumale]|nr:hypothetical protein HOY80DRAFT_1102917 [Tuber brumale]